MGPWPLPQIPTTVNSTWTGTTRTHSLLAHAPSSPSSHSSYEVTQWVNLGLTQLTNSTTKGRVYPHFDQCSKSVCSRKVALQAQETAVGGRRKALTLPAASDCVVWQRNPIPAVYRAFFRTQDLSQCSNAATGVAEDVYYYFICADLPSSSSTELPQPKATRLVPHCMGRNTSWHSVSSQVGLHLTTSPAALRSRQEIHLALISKNLHWVTVTWS